MKASMSHIKNGVACALYRDSKAADMRKGVGLRKWYCGRLSELL